MALGAADGTVVPLKHTNEAISAALAERARNVHRAWDPLHELGFTVVDDRGAALEGPDAAANAAKLSLARPSAPRFLMDRRRGFFTHSLVGNALLLLTGRLNARIPSADDLTIAAIARHPNRHYLANTTPVDLGSLVLIRHGATEANQQSIALGRSNGADGWRGVVMDATERAPPSQVEAWHRSTLLRTEQTARLFGITDASAHAALDEMEIGVAEGIAEATVISTFYSAHLMYVLGDPFAAIVDEFGLPNPEPPGECFVTVLLRTAACLATEILGGRT